MTCRSVFALLCTSVLFAQAPTAAPALEPIIALDRLSHAFGRIPPKAKVSTGFNIRNAGAGVLELREVKTSCGCTTALPEQRALGPGESTTLNVQFDPHKDRGPVYRGVSIVSNDRKRGTLDLEITADVVPSVMLSDYVIYLPALLPGDHFVNTTRCYSTTGQSVRVTGIKGGDEPYLRVEAVPQGNDLALNLTLEGSALPEGVPRGTQTVVLATDDPDTPEVALEVHWARGEALQAEPRRMAFDPAPAGSAPRLPLKVRQLRGKPFRILSCTASKPCFKVEGLQGKAMAVHDLEVIVAPGAPKGIQEGTLMFTTDDPNQKEVTVDVMAFLK